MKTIKWITTDLAMYFIIGTNIVFGLIISYLITLFATQPEQREQYDLLTIILFVLFALASNIIQMYMFIIRYKQIVKDLQTNEIKHRLLIENLYKKAAQPIEEASKPTQGRFK